MAGYKCKLLYLQKAQNRWLPSTLRFLRGSDSQNIFPLFLCINHKLNLYSRKINVRLPFISGIIKLLLLRSQTRDGAAYETLGGN